MSDALNEDKDPKILIGLSPADNPLDTVAGFSHVDVGREFLFKFLDGSTQTAKLVSTQAHCAYDDEGKPRNLMINLDFK